MSGNGILPSWRRGRSARRALERAGTRNSSAPADAGSQVLAHISNTPFDLIDDCQGHDIVVEADSPVAHGELMKNDSAAGMAEKHGVSVPQLSIRDCLEGGLLPLPKAASPAHMKSNAQVDFAISAEDMDVLKRMERIRNHGDASILPVYGGTLKQHRQVRRTTTALACRGAEAPVRHRKAAEEIILVIVACGGIQLCRADGDHQRKQVLLARMRLARRGG